MSQRHFPRPAELRPLIRFKRPTLHPTRRRLDAALTVADLRDIARRRTPKAAFDYTEGGPKPKSPSPAPGRPSETSSSTPRSCATSPTSIPAVPYSAPAPAYPSASLPPGSPA